MSNYATLKSAIQQVIKTNGNEEITGALLQQSLLAMIDSLGVGYQFMGIATPATNPGTPDQKVFYLAFDAGTYSGFGGTVLNGEQIGIFSYSSMWTYQTKNVGGGLFNVNAYNNKTDSYNTPFLARNAIPVELRKKGLVYTYLYGDVWRIEQYVGDSGGTFNAYTNKQFINVDAAYKTDFLQIPDGNIVKSIIREIYLTGIDNLENYKLSVYQNHYGVWGCAIKDNNNTIVARLRFTTTQNDGVFPLEEMDDSGISGFVYMHFLSDDINFENITFFESCVFLGKSPMIIKYLLEQQISALQTDVQEFKVQTQATVDELAIQLQEDVTLTPVFSDGYYLLNSNALQYSASGDYAVAVFDISNYVGKGGEITVSTKNFSNSYINLWGVVNAISANESLLYYGPRTNVAQSDVLQIPESGKYLLVQCKRTDHQGTAKIRVKFIPSLQKEVQKLQEQFIENVGISLPNKIYAVVGDTLQLFYRGIIVAPNPYNYGIVVNCSKGQQYERYFQYAPQAADVGTTTFEITLFNNRGEIVGTKSCDLVTVAAPHSPATDKKILCFGDSLTTLGDWPAECARRLLGTGGTPAGNQLVNLSFCGSKQKDLAGYFGVGGWTWGSYVGRGTPQFRFEVSGVTSISLDSVYSNNGFNYTVIEVNITGGTGNILCSTPSASNVPLSSGTLTKVSGAGDNSVAFSSVGPESANPLWDMANNKMSFVPYANQVSNGQIDVVCVLLTWNGLQPFKKDFTAMMAQVKTFADTLHTEFPNAKLKIMGIQAPNQKDLHGYGAGGYSNKYGMTYTVFAMNEKYQEFANQPAYSSFVEFVNISAQFDSEYNMPVTTRAVNVRNAQTEIVGNNGVHPAIDGYYQIADAIYRNIVANYCQ